MLILLFAESVAACAPAGSPTASPQLPPSTTSPDDVVSLANLHMVTATTGWAQRQSDGAVLHTTNGVLHWIVASPPVGSSQVLAVAFLDGETAQALVGNASTALNTDNSSVIHSWTTVNGGVTWTESGQFSALAIQYLPPGSLDFVDRQHSWYSITGLGAAGSSGMFIFATADGGQHWNEVEQTSLLSTSLQRPGSLPASCDKNPASFVNAETGWVTASCDGGAPFFFVTHDGGALWSAQPIQAPASEYGYVTDPPVFSNGEDGFMSGWIGTPGLPATLFVTSDGGRTWVARNLPGILPGGSAFLGAQEGWMLMSDATEHATLWATHDAGRTWVDLHADAELNGFSLDFATPQLGWACTGLPAPSPPAVGLFQTADGGHTWTAVHPTVVD
jgi:photosystem II stability/assembly factor-like uncharacterized protein